jgi:hypothetical protein
VALRDPEVKALLDCCHDLAENGKAAEAVRLLVERNRERRHPAIERALPALRHDAYLQLAPTQPSEQWPPSFVDPFPDEVGIPELIGEMPDLATLSGSLDAHGCLMVRNAIDELPTQKLYTAVDEAVRHARASLDSAERPGATPWFSPFTYQGTRPTRGLWQTTAPWGQVAICDAPRGMFELLDVLTKAGVVDLAAQYLGEPPLFIGPKGAFRRSPPNMPGGWHQDASIYGVDARALGFWLALSPCGPTIAPGLDLLPGHYDQLLDGSRVEFSPPQEKAGTSTVADDNDRGQPPGLVGLSNELIDDLARTHRPVQRPAFQPGDGVFFTHLVPHQAGAGPGFTDDRIAIELWFFAPSSVDVSNYPLWVDDRVPGS